MDEKEQARIRAFLECSSEPDPISDDESLFGPDSDIDPEYFPSDSESDSNIAIDENEITQDSEEDENDVLGPPAPGRPINNAFDWGPYEGRHKTFQFTGNEGLNVGLPNNITPTDAF